MARPALPRSRKNDIWDDPKVVVGDLLVKVPTVEREVFFEAVADRFPPVTVTQLRSYATWAEMIPPGERTVPASWTAYRELMKLAPAERAARLRPGMTYRQALESRGKDLPEQKPDKTQPARVKANRILKLLDDPDARVLVLEDAGFSREARRSVRAAAKRVAEEQRAARKLIEERIRKARVESARSYWKMHLHLVEEISQINAIANMHRVRGEIDDPEMAEALRNLANACEEVANYVAGSEPLDEIWDIEAEDDQLELGPGADES